MSITNNSLQLEADIFCWLEEEIFPKFDSENSCEEVIFDLSPEISLREKISSLVLKLQPQYPQVTFEFVLFRYVIELERRLADAELQKISKGKAEHTSSI